MPAETLLHRVIHFENSGPDAERIARVLRDEWPACEVVKAASLNLFEKLLRCEAFDVVLSSLAGIDGLAALRLARKIKPEVPFIFITSSVGEEAAVEALKLGASDLVMKDRLTRLV